MIITTKGVTSAGINDALEAARQKVGVPSGLVFTMLVVAELSHYDKVLAACIDAGREHPSRILLLTDGKARETRMDAEIRLGEEVPGEIISLRFHGELTSHRESAVLPLLLPDSPVIVWWPGTSPLVPSEDPIGRLGDRRITDAMGAASPVKAIEVRARNHSPGDTDLTWTRLTPWRALLAAGLDQYPSRIESIEVTAARNNAAGTLLAAWLDDRLKVPVRLGRSSRGVGITGVVIKTENGDISVLREDGKMAAVRAPGLPQRQVALRRRDINALITEELRRMDNDDILSSSLRCLVRRCDAATMSRPERNGTAGRSRR